MSNSQKTVTKLRKFFLNKYLIVLLIFFVFILFFDQHNLVNRWKTGRNIRSLEKEINYYNEEIELNKKKMNEMQVSDKSLEKYAREHYYLKKDSEDIFIIKEKNE
ncbi:MAG: septum formation initiator family protein [Paludibacteraceae bacterium]